MTSEKAYYVPASCYEMSSDNDAAKPLLEDDESNTSAASQQIRAPCAAGRRALLLGVLVGSLKDVISFVSFVLIRDHCGQGQQQHECNDGAFSCLLQRLPCWLLQASSKIDLLVCAITWFIFFSLLTGIGKLRMERLICCNCKKENSGSGRGHSFDVAILWLTGLVLGSFNLLLVLNFVFHLPIPVFPFMASAVLQLAVCYFVVLVYSGDDDDDKNDETLEESTAAAQGYDPVDVESSSCCCDCNESDRRTTKN